MNLLVFFIVLNIVNVILQTAKSLVTMKGGKWTAAIGNAIAYGVYTVLLVYMNCDLSLWAKVVVVGGCNLIGVYVVKLIEERMQKERLWKIELNVAREHRPALYKELKDCGISFNYNYVAKWALFNCYSYTKEQSKTIRELAKKYNAKCFANEAKFL